MAKFDFAKIGKRAFGVASGAGVVTVADHLIADDKVSPWLKGGAALLLGAALPEFGKGKNKDGILRNIGDGVLAGGSVIMTKAAIKAMEADPDPVAGIGNEEAPYERDVYNEDVTGLGDKVTDVIGDNTGNDNDRQVQI